MYRSLLSTVNGITRETTQQLTAGSWLALSVLAYILAITVAEGIGVFVSSTLGAAFHAALVVALLGHYVVGASALYRQILPPLALAPLLRILSLTLPLKEVPPIYWYALVGGPLLLAAMLAARRLGLPRSELGLGLRLWPVQLAIGISGLPLSLAAFLLLRADAPVAVRGWFEVAAGVISLMIFAGFLEELIFRGILQGAATRVFGAPGVYYSAATFVAMYLGSLSWGFTTLAGFIGLFFGWCAYKTSSIWGVSIAHGLINVSVVYVWPFTSLGRDQDLHGLLVTLAELTLWIASAATLIFLIARLKPYRKASVKTSVGPVVKPAHIELHGWHPRPACKLPDADGAGLITTSRPKPVGESGLSTSKHKLDARTSGGTPESEAADLWPQQVP